MEGKNIKILICDDNTAYSLLLKRELLEILSELRQNAEFILIQEFEQLKRQIENNVIDIIFLDIVIDNLSSIDYLTQNKLTVPGKIIIMTSYPEEAYNLSKIDNALFMVKSRTYKDYLRELLLKALNTQKVPSILAVKSEGKNLIIKTADIIYIESVRNNLLIHLKSKTIKTRSTIIGFYKNLPFNFLRIHKSYIINMDTVTETSPYSFVLNDGTSIQVNPKKYAELKTKYKKYIASLY